MSLLEHPFWFGSACFAAGAGIGYWLLRWKERTLRKARAIEEKALREKARHEADSMVREARLTANEENLRLKEQTENALQSRRQELGEMEKQLVKREALINQQLQSLLQDEQAMRDQQQEYQRKLEALETQRRELNELIQQRRAELQNISGLAAPVARDMLLKEVEAESSLDACNVSKRIMEEAKARAEEKARRVISIAIQRYAGEHTFETTSATLTLPDEELKGRIIGREGRNIRAFEAATGITVLIDDTPNAVVLSGFDPVRREIARESMQRLILDGRIHPTRIEEVVQKVTQEMDETILRAGEDAVLKTGLPPLHPEIVKLLGRLRFRQSFSQNLLEHSVEVAHITGLLAAELGLDPTHAKRAGLLHDIGKALNHEVEGAHALVGADFIRRCGEPEAVVNAVASHHDEAPHNGVLGILVGAADAISASRPGARSETMATYLKRVENLEQIGMSFPGVDKCYAVQAGRELRVFVQPEEVTDEQSYTLARNIARKIENDLQYPGQIRVTVMRETRCVEFAK